MTVDVSPGPSWMTPRSKRAALVHVVREPDLVRRLVVERDEQGFDAEDRADPFADELDDGSEVELPGQGVADVVDDRKLGVALVCLGQQPFRLVEQAGVLEGHGHARGERGQQPLVRLVVRVRLEVLEADDADDPVARQDRDTEPGVGFGAARDRPERLRVRRERQTQRPRSG